MVKALDYMETLELDEFSADECRITCLQLVSGQITEKENCNENHLDEVGPVEACGEVQLNFNHQGSQFGTLSYVLKMI
ncbi:hypothetical protein NPIL_146761 [Nephila pilipes]|uniref:Uncharacterized protein n=1 Tax=Nephila pilipes TaxID=299642 RepID=A0A8X6TY46_NEPPI|nr:hypothetical protein NPIL_146761 [Nephila pilipes]